MAGTKRPSQATTKLALKLSLAIILPIAFVVTVVLAARHLKHRRNRHAHILKYPCSVGRDVRDYTPLGQRLVNWANEYYTQRDRERMLYRENQHRELEARDRMSREMDSGRAVDLDKMFGLTKMANAAVSSAQSIADKDAGPEPIVFLSLGDDLEEERKWKVVQGNAFGTDAERRHRMENGLPTFPLKVADPQRSGLDVSDRNSQCSAGTSEFALEQGVSNPAKPRGVHIPSNRSLEAFDFSFNGFMSAGTRNASATSLATPTDAPSRWQTSRQNPAPSPVPSILPRLPALVSTDSIDSGATAASTPPNGVDPASNDTLRAESALWYAQSPQTTTTKKIEADEDKEIWRRSSFARGLAAIADSIFLSERDRAASALQYIHYRVSVGDVEF